MTPVDKAKMLIALRHNVTKKEDLEMITKYFSKREQ